MKKLIASMVMVVFAFTVMAHPPKKVMLKYTDGKIIVEAPHAVKDLKKHYISKITATVNDGEAIVFSYTEQSSLQKADITLDLPDLKSGDVVKVKAKCNKGGAKEAEITIE